MTHPGEEGGGVATGTCPPGGGYLNKETLHPTSEILTTLWLFTFLFLPVMFECVTLAD